MANQHSSARADDPIHACLDLGPYRVVVEVSMHLLDESDDKPFGQVGEKP
jgi:hypothetical protein